MINKANRYAEVLVPRDTGYPLVYAVPDQLRSDLRQGDCVRVHVLNSAYIGLIWRYPISLPRRLRASQVRAIDDRIHPKLRLPISYCQYLAWSAQYYMGSIQQVTSLALEVLHKSDGTRLADTLSSLFSSPTPPTHPPDPAPREGSLVLDQLRIRKGRPLLWHPYTLSSLYAFVKAYLASGNGPILYLFPEQRGLASRYAALKASLPAARIGMLYGTQKLSTRLATWIGALRGHYDLLLSTQSGIWLPFQQLGCVLVEEEASGIYRERYRAFRYHARDMAIQRAHMLESDCLLTSQSPSIESHHNAQLGKYAHYASPTNAIEVKKHAFQWIDLLDTKRKHRMHSEGLSQVAYKALRNALECQAGGVIVHPDKIYAGYVYCGICNQLARCAHCAGVIQAPKSNHMRCVRCHKPPDDPNAACTHCGNKQWMVGKEGIQKIAEYIQSTFSDIRIGCVDLPHKRPSPDTITRMWHQLNTKQIDLVLTTPRRMDEWQARTHSVLLCWEAQSFLSRSDFRVYERFFQWAYAALTKTSTAGASFIIQARSPEHPMIAALKRMDTYPFAQQEAKERQELQYPPFQKHIYLHLQAAKAQQLEEAVQLARKWLQRHQIVEHMSSSLPRREPKSFSQYLCIQSNKSIAVLSRIKAQLLACKKALIDEIPKLSVHFEVDP